MRNWLFIKYPKCEIGFLLYNQNAGKMENWLFINKLDNLLFSKLPKIKKWLFLNNQMRDWLFIK